MNNYSSRNRNITVNDIISMTGELVTTTAVVIESITVNDTI
jgi:hypothetical protein